MNGSPTVSPTTAALWAVLPFAAVIAFFNVFLSIIPCTAGVGHKMAISTPVKRAPVKSPPKASGAKDQAYCDRSKDCHKDLEGTFLLRMRWWKLKRRKHNQDERYLLRCLHQHGTDGGLLRSSWLPWIQIPWSWQRTGR